MDIAEAKVERSFGWLNATQFLGALNDNIFKLLIIAFIIGIRGVESTSNVTALAGAVFVVPFLLFSAYAGKLADRFSKRNIIVVVKCAEVIVMTLGFVGFMLRIEWVLYVVLFLMAAQSAFFSPSKYGIIPELVDKERLSYANSLLVGLTYLAIVIGAGFVPLLLYVSGKSYGVVGLMCVGIAIVGLVVSLPIKKTPAAGSGRGASIIFLRDIWRTLWSIHRKRDLLLAVLASAYFLLIVAFILLNVIPYGMERLGFDETQGGYLFLPGAIGIGFGAFLAGRLSGRNVELGLVPLGAVGLSVFSAALGLTSGGIYTVFVLVFLIGASAGLFIVPIRAFIQLRSPRRRRGEIIATSGFLGWVGVFLASGLVYFFSGILGLSVGQVFVVLGVMTLGLAVGAIILLPDFLVRFICLLFTRLCYRIRVFGIENVPSEGGALLVCNHVSWVDALLLNTTQQRRIRFVMEKGYYDSRLLRPICRLMRVIPISASDSPKKIVAALRQGRRALDEGRLVCIFAEGAMTRSGMLREFRGGLERIMKGTRCDIIPVYMGGVWGSIFSYYYGRPLSTIPKKFPYPVSIHFGEPMPADSTTEQVRRKVLELSCEYFDGLKNRGRSLGEHFVRTARKNFSKRCMSDSTGRRLNYGQSLAGAIVLADRIAKLTGEQEKIGILLPPSVGGVLANAAVTMLGKVTVNLNYTVSEDVIKSAVEQCGIRSIISSRRFVEKIAGLGKLPGLIFIEDISGDAGLRVKIKAYLRARFVPRGLLMKIRTRSNDDLATIIFSSGSSGQPKGVMLSHHNILSNIEAVRMVFRLREDDNLCAVLPFFHSFGFTCALWLPIVSGVSAGYVASPIDGALVGRCVQQNRSTVLFAAPTFLLNYARRVKREDFASLRSVVAGAEKLKRSVADGFEAKFGVRPLEGYGVTELSPVVSLNLADVETGGVEQIGNKEGTVGQPIPGVAVRIVSPESKKEMAVGELGLLIIKGPNVMLGYLNKEKKTAEALKDGWYNTGDIASIDKDGFLTITDRLSRFSKIGGEMIPHVGVEEVYLRGLDTDEQVIAVTGVPDARKGEELVVLHLEKAGEADKLHGIISRSNLPNMWKPRRDNYIRIESMPALGSGKLDIVRLRKIAMAAKGSSGKG